MLVFCSQSSLNSFPCISQLACHSSPPALSLFLSPRPHNGSSWVASVDPAISKFLLVGLSVVCGKWAATHRRNSWAECIINQDTARKKAEKGTSTAAISVTDAENEKSLWLLVFSHNRRRLLGNAVWQGWWREHEFLSVATDSCFDFLNIVLEICGGEGGSLGAARGQLRGKRFSGCNSGDRGHDVSSVIASFMLLRLVELIWPASSAPEEMSTPR